MHRTATSLEWTYFGRSLLGLLVGLVLCLAAAKVLVHPLVSIAWYWSTGQIATDRVVACLPGLAVAAVVGMPLLGLGWWAAVGRVTFRADGVNRVLVRSIDLLIFRRTTRYPFGQFTSVCVTEFVTRGRINRPSVTVTAESSGHAVVLCSERRPEASLPKARAIAEALGVPLQVDLTVQPPEPELRAGARVGRAVLETISWLS